MIGGHFTMNGRPLTIIGSYEGHGPDEPCGWIYTFDDQPGRPHWIPARAVPMRFEKKGSKIMDLLSGLSWWWNHDAEWYQFWFPGSGPGGGIIMGTMVFAFGAAVGWLTNSF